MTWPHSDLNPPSQGVFTSQHPLVCDKLTALRRRETEPKLFRELIRELSWLLAYEALADARLDAVQIETPMAQATGQALADRIGLVPILRAGISMADGVLQMVPLAQVWHLGMYRDHETLQPVAYYNKLPHPPRFDLALVLDPMLATGGSAIAAIDVLQQAGIRRIKFIGLIGAPEGVARVRERFPNVPIHLAALDERLDEHSYIVPGLGDAGDRQFFTA
ncbi:MAG: uracil phosphoribosyltransferase [Dehalococcoidia bacterium]